MKKLRTLRDNKAIWFVVRDIMKELGYSRQTHPERVISSIPIEWKTLKRVLTNGGVQFMWCVSEDGLKYLCEHCCRPMTETLTVALGVRIS
jgi:prophage antirepressor-like protein